MEAVFTTAAPERGLWAIGPVTATVSDPLGLTERSWSASSLGFFVVHPKVGALSVLPPLASAASPGDGGQRVQLQRGDDLHGVREYQDGDDLRRVHWRATARWDRLMVRQDDEGRSCLVCVGLDLRAERHSAASLERSVEAAASIASMVLTQRAGSLRLTTTGGQRYGPRSGHRALGDALDLLAMTSTDDNATELPLLGGRGEVAVLVSPTEEAAEELLVREHLGAQRSLLVVLTDEGPADGQPGMALRRYASSSVPVRVLRAGHGLARPWAEAMSTFSRSHKPVLWSPPAARWKPTS
jgi:uncharacterized protein (DUF58 family)